MITQRRDSPQAPPSGPPPRAEAPRIFHRVMDASLVNVRHTLIDLRNRFEGRADPDTLNRLELVLAEVLNNITLHGADGQPVPGALTAEGLSPDGEPDDRVVIHLTVTQHGGGLACAVIDDGSPLPESCLIFPDSAPTPEVSAMRAGGFGWFIIRDLTRSLFYFREDDRNVLCFNIPRRNLRRGGRAGGGAPPGAAAGTGAGTTVAAAGRARPGAGGARNSGAA